MRVYTESDPSGKRVFQSEKSGIPIQVLRQAFLHLSTKGKKMMRVGEILGKEVVGSFSFSGITMVKQGRNGLFRVFFSVRKQRILFSENGPGSDALFFERLSCRLENRKTSFRKPKTDSRYSGWFETEERCYLPEKQSVLREDARLDPVFVFAKGFGSIEGGRPVFLRPAGVKNGQNAGARALFAGEVLYNVSSLAGL